MWYLIFKTAHVIGFVSWFAGLFYLGRLFVYHREALDQSETEKLLLSKQYGIMEWRVYKIILNPAMNLTWLCGLCMLYMNGYDWFKLNLWMHFKLLFLLILTGYQLYLKGIIKRFDKYEVELLSSLNFRLINEVPTIILLLIATLAVFKNNTNPITLTLSTLVFIGFILVFTLLYKRQRAKNK